MSFDPRLHRLLDEIRNLRRYQRGGRKAPHELVLLLAVLDCFDDGHAAGNRIELDDFLHERFLVHFARFAQPGERPQIAYPFFHLRTASFWKHAIRSGKESAYRQLQGTSVTKRKLEETVAFASLSEDAFAVFQNPSYRGIVRRFIERLLVED